MSGATILVDTREKLPYVFDPKRARTVRRALRTGDYSLEGFEDVVTVERKNVDDLVSTVTHGRERFRRELQRLAAYEAACVVVEGNLRDVLDGCYISAAHPNAIFGTVVSIIVDFRIPVFFCADRDGASRFVEAYLLRFHRKVRERLGIEREEA